MWRPCLLLALVAAAEAVAAWCCTCARCAQGLCTARRRPLFGIYPCGPCATPARESSTSRDGAHTQAHTGRNGAGRLRVRGGRDAGPHAPGALLAGSARPAWAGCMTDDWGGWTQAGTCGMWCASHAGATCRELSSFIQQLSYVCTVTGGRTSRGVTSFQDVRHPFHKHRMHRHI